MKNEKKEKQSFYLKSLGRPQQTSNVGLSAIRLILFTLSFNSNKF